MKAISLWQPWASAMAYGTKRNETRSWPTEYRGDLVICSAKRKPTLQECGDAETFKFALTAPFGFALCIVELFECVPTDYFMLKADRAKLPLRTISIQEWELGNYAQGRFAWLTRNLRKFKEPVPVTGQQGFFNLPPDVESAIKAQL